MRVVGKLRPSGIEPVLAVHEFAPALAPGFEDIKVALAPERAVRLATRWAELAASINRGLPLSLAGPSPYVDQLTNMLAVLGLLDPRAAARAAPAEHPGRNWARKPTGRVDRKRIV